VRVGWLTERASVVVAFVLLVVALAAAVSVDVVRAGYGVKSDEATYVSMALSVAFDHDLAYERVDLERFAGLYRSGPEGIFLKRGRQLPVSFHTRAPLIKFGSQPDPRPDRLYFGKAILYPIAAAPFVRLFGLNGFLIFHVLLLFVVLVCGYTFLASQSDPAGALVFTLAFVGATVVPVYAVFLTPEIFTFALVFVAYFFWLYKEVAPAEGYAIFRGFRSDLIAAALLGCAAYSKPPYAPLIAPMVLLLFSRRLVRSAAVAAAVFAAVTLSLFTATFFVTGEFNYQGGDRKTFYGRFPFDSPEATWERTGVDMTTNDSDAKSVLEPSELVNRLELNVEYFLVGRHFGFVPYFFPGVVAVLFWLASRERFVAWRLLTFAGVVVSTLTFLLLVPYTWSGGGGPPGNRYGLPVYAAVFFLTPPLASVTAGLLAWVGGALFTARMLIDPFGAAKFPFQITERGPARRLPVELTMANDLPVMLDSQNPRARIPYGQNPTLLLYFLDRNAYTPEPAGIWVSGSGRADILVRSEQPLAKIVVSAQSRVRTVFNVSAGGVEITVTIAPGKPVRLDVPAEGVRAFNSYAYLLSARSSDAFVPHLLDPGSNDWRNLGVQVQLTPVVDTGK